MLCIATYLFKPSEMLIKVDFLFHAEGPSRAILLRAWLRSELCLSVTPSGCFRDTSSSLLLLLLFGCWRQELLTYWSNCTNLTSKARRLSETPCACQTLTTSKRVCVCVRMCQMQKHHTTTKHSLIYMPKSMASHINI